jgi:hypothetical protein
VKRTVFAILGLLSVLFGLFCALHLLSDLEPLTRALMSGVETAGAVLIFSFLAVRSVLLSIWFFRYSCKSER